MLMEKIYQEINNALKAKDAVKVSTLRMLKASIKNVLIEKKADKLEDIDVIRIINKQVKQRKDSIEKFKEGKREDLASKEEAELKILESYLPKPLSEDELKKIIGEAIKEAGAESKKDMGRVMKVAIEKVAGRADNKTVSRLISERLK